jgi:tripartite-type tricarboxylate transporter receptor subunit TctC
MISYLIRKLAMLARNLGLIALAVGLAGGARSQDWPQRPVTVIVPFAAGGSTDGIARSIAQWLSDNLHQQFVVENRAGAGGAIAAELAARAPADGYTCS